jgi:hypothetical protein
MTDSFLERSATRIWLKAVRETGQRLLDLNRLMIELFEDLRQPGAPDRKRARLRNDTSDSLRATEHFHMVAVKKSMEGAERLRTAEPTMSVAVSQYIEALPGARKLRNMREHDWEHMAGAGHHQKEFVHDTTDSEGNVVHRIDATSTRIGPDGYWIGGRHRVETAIASAQTLLEVLLASDERPALLP